MAEARAAEKVAAQAPFDVLVVGGGPAGAAAAVYAARKGIRTGIAAERFGGQVLDTMAIENFISVPHTEGPKLVAALEQHVKDYDVEVMNLQTAVSLTSATQSGGYHEIALANGASLKAKTLILSTGARWRQMNVPARQNIATRASPIVRIATDRCSRQARRGDRRRQLGRGGSDRPRRHCCPCHADRVRQRAARRCGAAKQAALAEECDHHHVGANDRSARRRREVAGLTYKDRKSGEERRVDLEGIFVQIGLVPNTEWLKGVVALSPRGEIEVDARGETSVPGVFAAGDATTVPYKQIIIAMGEGSKAALSASII